MATRMHLNETCEPVSHAKKKKLLNLAFSTFSTDINTEYCMDVCDAVIVSVQNTAKAVQKTGAV